MIGCQWNVSLKVLVNINVDPKYVNEVCEALVKLDKVTRLYEVTGEYDLFLEVEVESVDEFRDLLKEKILSISGVRLTESSVVLGVWKT